MAAQFTPEQLQQFAEVAKATPQEEMEAIQEGWSELLPEIRANYELDPASPEAQALGARAEELKTRTLRAYEGFPDLLAAIRGNYERGAFEGDERALQAADTAFLERVKAAQAGRGDAT